MIIGIGTDITDIRRIEQSLARFGARFEERIFTPAERAKAQSREPAGHMAVAATYAKRFAAKEACAKALGTGMNSGVHWHDMEVTNLASGRPGMQLSGKALEILAAMLPPGTKPVIHVSLTDDWPTAQAFLVVEALPLP